MTSTQEKLLNLYFTKAQQQVINTHEGIKQNILNFIEGYKKLSSFIEANADFLDKSINDYRIIYPIRNVLDFIANLRLKKKDDLVQKVNDAFEQITCFDYKSSENLIFCNLLLSENKLVDLSEKLQENLLLYRLEEIQVNEEIPYDFYESILIVSDSNLNILKKDNHDNIQSITRPDRPLRFKSKAAIRHLGNTRENAQKHLTTVEQRNSNTQGIDSDAGNSVQSLHREQGLLSREGANEKDGHLRTDEPNSSKTSNSSDSDEYRQTNDSNKPPFIVVEKANELFHTLNEGLKSTEQYIQLSISKVAFDGLAPIYLLSVLNRNYQIELGNVIDEGGLPVFSANWRGYAGVLQEIESYKSALNKNNIQSFLLDTITSLADTVQHAEEFIDTISSLSLLDTEERQFSFNELFDIHLGDNGLVINNKIESWFINYQKKKKHNAILSLREDTERLSQRERTPRVPRTGAEGRIGGLFGTDGGELHTERGGSSNGRNGGTNSHRTLLEQSDSTVNELERFYLESTGSNKFSVSEKLQNNLDALTTLDDIIATQRSPTQADRKVLSAYVGFGGLKDILLNPANDESWGESNKQNREATSQIRAAITQLESRGFSGLLHSVQSTILDAFYTNDVLISNIYKGIQALGFEKGTILEPSAGIGNFIGLMPPTMREGSAITQVEIDPISAFINKLIYSDTTVIPKPLQASELPSRSYDLIISNIPFGDSKVYDPAFKGELAPFLGRIHTYFFAKALELAKEGAIIAFVASKRVLDSPSNQPIREYIEANGNFLGAVRLPHKTFENANTQANADIIFIQKTTPKLTEDIVPIIRDSVRIDTLTKDGLPAHYNMNSYFVQNPQNVLGEIRLGGMYDQNDYKVLGSLDNDLLANAIAETLNLSKHQLIPLSQSLTKEGNLNDEINRKIQLNEIFADLRIGEIGLLGKILHKRISKGSVIEIKSTETLEKISDYLKLKKALVSLINAEYNDVMPETIEDLRDILRAYHYNFIQKHGAYDVSLKKIKDLDEGYYHVASLRDKSGKEADILHFRTIVPMKKVGQVTDIQDAITVSLYEYNKIDIEYIAELMEKSVEAVLEEGQNYIFYDPQLKKYVHRDEYLSGNVKAKLTYAKAEIGQGNLQYSSHIEELEKVVPKEIPANLIEVTLGARWVPIAVYQAFLGELLQTKNDVVKIHYNKAADAYEIYGENYNTLTKGLYSTPRLKDVHVIEYAFGMESPVIRDKVSSNPDKYVVNKEQTAIAAEKVTLVKEKFAEWIWKSPQRREELGKMYNDLYNTTVLRKYDGSKLNFEGLNGITLNPHQKDAIWRLVQNNGGIIDHIVGAGKTFIMVGTAMKMKQLSIAQKPLIIALKSTVPQIVDAFRTAYPLANVLAPTENDFKKENRLALFSKIALNDWDCVIMSHDNFNTIPQAPHYERQQTELELQELYDQINDIEDDYTIDYKTKKKMVARLQGQVKKMDARLEKLLDRAKDYSSLDFQQMGIDHVMVDESQQFKNLAYRSKINNVAGMSKQEGSKRAFNLLVAIRSLQDKYNEDKGVTFLSGTPISNSLVEMYLLFKYLRPSKMKELGFDTFDQWATNFAVPKTDVEFSITGEFKNKTRFSEFINVPELAILYTEIADIRNDDNLVLDKPKMLGNGYQVKTLAMNEAQKDFGKRIIEFAKTKKGELLGIGKLTEGQENAYMLLATNLANKMSIDMRLIDPSFSYDPNGKVGTMVKTVYQHYVESSLYKGTQLIFSDTGTPKSRTVFADMMFDYLQDEVGVDVETIGRIFGGTKTAPTEALLRERIKTELLLDDEQLNEHVALARKSADGFNLYQEIKFRLTEIGIPADEIAFIHDYSTATKKEQLFDKVNDGEIRVVLGSTQKLGTGVNVQKRLVALHHIDAPWRPSDMEQRNGRGLRQGNKIAKEFYNNELPIYTYCSELSLDTFKYQLLHTKDFLIKQVKNTAIDPTMRVVREGEGGEDGGMNFGEILANLSGNTDILEKIKLEQLVQKLEKSKKAFESEVYDAAENIARTEKNITENKANVEKSLQEIEASKVVPKTLVEVETGRFIDRIVFENAQLNGKSVETRKEFGEELDQLIKEAVYQQPNNIKIPVTTLWGYDIFAEKVAFFSEKTAEVALSLKGASGTFYSFNDSNIPGVLVNSLEKTLLNFEHILNAQTQTLERNIQKLDDYKQLSTRTWNKGEELSQAKEKLKQVVQRLQSIEGGSQEQSVSLNPSTAPITSVKAPAPKIKLVGNQYLQYLWSIDSPILKEQMDNYIDTSVEKNLKEQARSMTKGQVEDYPVSFRKVIEKSIFEYCKLASVTNWQLDWHNLSYQELPLAHKFLPNEDPTKRLFIDFSKPSQSGVNYIAIENDYVLVLPPTKSMDSRMLNLPTLTYEDCEHINKNGKYNYHFYPRVYAEQFVKKTMEDTLNLLQYIPVKELKAETPSIQKQLVDFFQKESITPLSDFTNKDYDDLLKGKMSSLIQSSNGFGKVKIIAKDKDGLFSFRWYERKETLSIPISLVGMIIDDDLDWMKKYKHLGRTINFSRNGINKPCYFSLDTEINTFFIIETEKVQVPTIIAGQTLSEQQHKSLAAGMSVLLQKLSDKNNPPVTYDGIVSIDACSQGLITIRPLSQQESVFLEKLTSHANYNSKVIKNRNVLYREMELRILFDRIISQEIDTLPDAYKQFSSSPLHKEFFIMSVVAQLPEIPSVAEKLEKNLDNFSKSLINEPNATIKRPKF